MNILFTICGRAGSKGIKNKNLIDFVNYPLAFYTISVIDLYIKLHDEDSFDVALSTDSKQLQTLFTNNLKNNVNIIDRKAELSGDQTPKIAVIADCLKEMQLRKSRAYNMVVDLDITSPLRTVRDLAKIIKQKKNVDTDVVFSVTGSRRNPYFNMVAKKENGYNRVIESEFNCRQEAPLIFDMNASLYAYSPDFLISGKNIFDGKCDIIEMMDTGVLDLDHKNDFVLMQVIAKYLFAEYEEFKEIRDNIKEIIIDDKET